MKLKISERIQIMNSILPKQSSIIEQLLIRDIGKKLELSQEEIKAIGLKQNDTNLMWKSDKDIEKDIDFSSVELKFLKNQVNYLDRNKKIGQSNLDVCLKITEEK